MKKMQMIAVAAVCSMSAMGTPVATNIVEKKQPLVVELASDAAKETERGSMYKENVAYVKKLLDKASINYGSTELGNEATCFVYSLPSPYESITCILGVMAEAVECNAYHPETVRRRLPELAEFVVRVNMSANYGGFELDYDEGRISYNYTVPISSLRADEKGLFNSVIYLPVERMHQYIPAINAVREGKMTPKKAAEPAE